MYLSIYIADLKSVYFPIYCEVYIFFQYHAIYSISGWIGWSFSQQRIPLKPKRSLDWMLNASWRMLIVPQTVLNVEGIAVYLFIYLFNLIYL